MVTKLAAEDVRRNALPQKAEDYKLELPKDFPLPQGVEFKLDATKPELSKFREVALKRGLDQDTVTELLGVYAEGMVGDEAALQTARKAEIEKLGANGTARITALETFFGGLVGPDLAKEGSKMMVTAGIVKFLEQVASKFSTQGAASFSTAHRDPGPGAGKIEGYEKMSFEQRRLAQDNQRRRAG